LQPAERVDQTKRYAFIQLGSTKKWRDNKATVDRILGMWRSTPAGRAGAPLVVAGDEETYRFLHNLQTEEPGEYRQIRRYPGDWHMLYHIAKALLRRDWGAGMELMAMFLGTDDKKSGEGSNYRRAHHHLTVMFEAIWAICQEEYFKQCPATTQKPVGHDDHVDGIVRWVRDRAKAHKTFAIWEQFLLHDYPAYMAFRSALRTGDFMLRLDALRRIAPIFCITGEDRYQFLCADHLQEMARLSPSDQKVVAELFSVYLGFDAHARLGLDERQEVANRLFKTVTKKISSSVLPKLAPVAQLREVAHFEFDREFVVKSDSVRDRKRELVLKRRPAVRTAIECLRRSPAFTDAGKLSVQALDGRRVSAVEREAILRAPALATAKFDDVVSNVVLGDKSKKGATKKKIESFKPANTTTKATKTKGRTSALKDNSSNAAAYGREMNTVLCNLLESRGTLTPEEVQKMLSGVGAALPYVMASVGGGPRHANKSAWPINFIDKACPDALADNLFWEPTAHAVDVPVEIHGGGKQYALEGGPTGVIDHFFRELYRRWLRKDVELLVVCNDRKELVEMIKAPEQSERTAKV
ncbi:unnamed protein product, partial [Laminaria digitata]